MAFFDGLRNKDQQRGALCRRFVDLVRVRLPQAELEETGPMQYRVSGPGLSESTVFLENLFRQIGALPQDEADTLIERHVENVVDSTGPLPAEVRRGEIVPMIKDQSYLDQVGDSVPLVREHLAADLWIIYAVDLPKHMMTLRADQVSALGLEADGAGLRALAIENLTELLPPAEFHGEGSWFLMTAGSDYTASLLLVDAVWEEVAGEIAGDPVVAVPTRDVLLVTGSASAEGIAAVRAKAIELVQGGSYAISETLLRRRAGRWVALS